MKLARRAAKTLGVAAAVGGMATAADAFAQSAPVTLRQAPSVSDDDYPGRALRGEVEGRVIVDVDVDATGQPTGCTVVAVPRADFGLEAATCSIWTGRALYAPARNASGQAVAGVYRAMVNWRIPEPPAIPAPQVAAAAPTQNNAYSEPVSRVQTIRCANASGFFIWRVDLDNRRITETMSGTELEVLDVETLDSDYGAVEAASDAFASDDFMELVLFFTERELPDGNFVPVFTHQVLGYERGMGDAYRIDRYEADCQPYGG